MKLLFLSSLTNKLFGAHLEFRARLFNATLLTVTLAGGFVSVWVAVSARGKSIAGIPGLVLTMLAFWLLHYANKSGNHRRCYWILTLIPALHMPVAFHLNGGFNGGVFSWFVFYVTLQVFWFDDKKALIFPLALIAEFAAICVFAHYDPRYIRPLGETERFLFSVIVFVIVSVSLSVIMLAYLRSYDRQKRELDEARRSAVEHEKKNRALVADMSHELRTPLAVMSGYALYAVEQIKTKGVTEETLADLSAISEEAGRLAKMADETLAILRSSSVLDKSADHEMALVDTGTLVKKIAALQKPVAERIGLDLQTRIDARLPPVTGDAGELAQVIWNILQNAMIHSSADTVTVSAKADGTAVSIIVEDDGDGIEDKLLSRIFERDARAKGKAGLGLPISRDIARRHGGDIAIESKQGSGTRVTISLPLSSKSNIKRS